jgi:cobalt-zinc-cadmium efflux system membrane fusion protein
MVAGTTIACGRDAAEPTAPAAASPAPETHPEEENAIHLSEDMMRDLRLSTAPVEERAGAQEVMALGELTVDESRYAEVAPPTGAQVVRVLAATNAVVTRGAPLAELRSPDLGRARANLSSAEARVELTRQTLERKRALAEERIVAQREVQEAEAAFRAAQAEHRAATSSLQALGISDESPGADGSLFLLRSPIAGRVIDRHAVIGKYADPATALFTIADLGRVWMIARAFERDAVRIPVGSLAHVTLAALPGEEFDGRVTLVGRQVESDSRTLPVRIELENSTGVLRPGMSAAARLQVGDGDRTLLAVPPAALQRVGDGWLAFVPHGAGEFEMRRVGRGRDLGNAVEVVSGLRAGETVVVEGAFVLKAEAEKRAGGVDEHGH